MRQVCASDPRRQWTCGDARGLRWTACGGHKHRWAPYAERAPAGSPLGRRRGRDSNPRRTQRREAIFETGSKPALCSSFSRRVPVSSPVSGGIRRDCHGRRGSYGRGCAGDVSSWSGAGRGGGGDRHRELGRGSEDAAVGATQRSDRIASRSEPQRGVLPARVTVIFDSVSGVQRACMIWHSFGSPGLPITYEHM